MITFSVLGEASGMTLPMQMSSDALVCALKSSVADVLGIPAAQQQIVVDGAVLSDGGPAQTVATRPRSGRSTMQLNSTRRSQRRRSGRKGAARRRNGTTAGRAECVVKGFRAAWCLSNCR